MPYKYIYNPLIPENLDKVPDVDAAMSHFVGVSGICTDANKLGARIAQFSFDGSEDQHNFCLNARIEFMLQQINPYGNQPPGGSRTYVQKSGTLDISISIGEIGDDTTTKELVALVGAVNMPTNAIRLVKTVVPHVSAVYDLYLQTAELGERYFFTFKSNADADPQQRITAIPVIAEDLVATPYTNIYGTLFSDDKTRLYTVYGANTYTFNHGLGKYPSVSIIDENGNMVLADVHYDDMNTVTINWTELFSGTIVFN
ncbi:MAG: hypothetical protein K5860_06655 [Bacteroidales bacterium]|nr:hypothetical protein [Bacteroidales bacterium]